MTNIQELRRLLEGATKGDLSTAERHVESEFVECPFCVDGEIEAADYCNFDGKALGVQFYGIGSEFGAHERLWTAVMATLPALLDEVETLRAAATLPAEPVREMREGDTARTIEILRRALAWHGDPQRMATTREEWQQEIDAAIAWVKANPEEGRPSFSSLGDLLPSEDGWRETASEAFHAIDAALSTSDDVIEWNEPIRASKRGQADDDELRRERKSALYGMLDSAREKLRAALSGTKEQGEGK